MSFQHYYSHSLYANTGMVGGFCGKERKRAKMAKTVTLKDMAGDAIMCLMLKTNYYNISLFQFLTLFILLNQIKL